MAQQGWDYGGGEKGQVAYRWPRMVGRAAAKAQKSNKRDGRPDTIHERGLGKKGLGKHQYLSQASWSLG